MPIHSQYTEKHQRTLFDGANADADNAPRNNDNNALGGTNSPEHKQEEGGSQIAYFGVFWISISVCRLQRRRVQSEGVC